MGYGVGNSRRNGLVQMFYENDRVQTKGYLVLSFPELKVHVQVVHDLHTETR